MANASTATPHDQLIEAEAISRTEIPVRFPVADDRAFGILTEPLGPPRGIGVVLLNATSDRNRVQPRLARRLAALGFHVLRFDYRGFGESSGPSSGSALKHAVITLATNEEPFGQDLHGAIEELHRRGLDKVVLIGRCFGARTALLGVQHARNLLGVALISPPLHERGQTEQAVNRWALDDVRNAARHGAWTRILRGMRDPRRRQRWMRKLHLAAGQLFRRRRNGGAETEWLSKSVVDSLRALVSRGVPVMFVYGRGSSMYRDFVQLQTGTYRELFDQAGDRITLAPIEGMPNNLTSLDVQDNVLDLTIKWVQSSIKD
jgi:pimeloyl-ACP methyl ester carboxylesterase